MAHPLLCWDICVEGHNRRIEFAHDLEKLHRMMMQYGWVLPGISLINGLVWEDKVVLVTTPSLQIVHATSNMVNMSGYQPYEVIGHTPALFQGRATEQAEKKRIRAAINAQQPFESTLTNYKKDGRLYRCHIEAYPVFNSNGTLVHFVALENAAA